MSLTDIVSAMRLHLFAEAALVLAAAGFATVLVTVFLRSNRAAFERARFLPLEDDRETSHE
jgi:cbb3-type cytochrome oxidase subunit 3